VTLVTNVSTTPELVRPERLPESPVPPMPAFDASRSDVASVQLSEHRTQLSTHRTALSEHRTALSEHRTDLSQYRTTLSTNRTEMSMRRTGMSFQRTRLSAERTLMSVIRTSLSLISFGFTIFQFFHKLQESDVLANAHAARNFGKSLVMLGIAMLVFGIVYHVRLMLELRRVRGGMTRNLLIHGESGFPVSFTLITAVALLIIGIIAISNMVFNVGPFG
jgi:uncharacterized membrane protein YidH (DUF202 family)